MQVPFNFVENIFGGSSQEDGAGFGVLALGHEGEILIPDLLYFEQPAVSSHIRLLQLFRSIHNGGSSDPGDSVVVSLPDPSDDCAVASLHQEVLGSVRHSLLSDHHIWLHLQNFLTHPLNLFFLHIQSFFEVFLFVELHVGHGLAFLVLEGAVQQDHSGVLNVPSLPRVGHIFVEHDSIQDAAVFQVASWYLLDLGVSFHVDLHNAPILPVDCLHGLHCQVYYQVAPLGRKLSPNATLHDLLQVIFVLNVNRDSKVFNEDTDFF
mmetsp:Transcript_24793/g.24304  ORF Transcript_24793/g.24304 Transcript_24793/m.24304 type:complete len:264 (-) Transcript_24793:397-1188(-)